MLEPFSARGLIDAYYEITSLLGLLLQTPIRDAYLTHLNYVLYLEMYPGAIPRTRSDGSSVLSLTARIRAGD